MALLASELIDQARDYHASFSPEKIPGPMALRALSRIERDLSEALASESEEAMASALSFAPEQVEEALAEGYLALPDHYLVLGAHGLWEGVRRGVKLISYADQARRYAYSPSACLIGQRLVLTDLREAGLSGSGWEGVERLDVLLALRPVRLQSPKQELVISPLAEDALVRQLALWMAGRSPGALAELPRLAEEASQSAERFLSMLAEQGATSLHSVVRTAP